MQSLLSMALSLVMGLGGALGLLWLSSCTEKKTFSFLSFLCLLPNFLPPLFVIILSSGLIPFLPHGLWGLVFFHSFINVGLVSLIVYTWILQQALPWWQFSMVAGVSPLRFIIFILLPNLRFHFLSLSFFLLVLYMLSFSIPALIGGSIYGGIEVFIYEKIVTTGNWSQVVPYALGLFVLTLLGSRWLGIDTNMQKWNPPEAALGFKKIAKPWCAFFALGPGVFLMVAVAKNFWSLVLNPDLTFFNLLSLRASLQVSLLTALMTLLVASLLSYSFVKPEWSRWLLAWTHPGWVIMGFSLLLLGPESPFWSLLKNALGLSLLFLPYLYRLTIHRELQELRGQVMVAQIFPVSWFKIYWFVILPAIFPSICAVAILAGWWALGDFALSEILLAPVGVQTLAMEMKNALSTYDQAQALALLTSLWIPGVVLILIFQGMSYVSCRRISSLF